MNQHALQLKLRALWEQRDPRLAGISAGYLSDVTLGRRAPGPKILTALGLRRVVRYEPMERDA